MSISAAVSQVQLASIREVPLEDITEVEGHRKQTAVEQTNDTTTQPEIYSSSLSVTVRAPPPFMTSRARIRRHLVPVFHLLTTSTLLPILFEHQDRRSTLKACLAKSRASFPVVSSSADMKMLMTQRNIPPSAAAMTVSPQASGADPLNELEVLGTGDPAGVVRHHKHRKRHQRHRGVTSPPKGRTADRYAALLSEDKGTI